MKEVFRDLFFRNAFISFESIVLYDFAKNIFNDIIDDFANMKSCKVFFKNILPQATGLLTFFSLSSEAP